MTPQAAVPNALVALADAKVPNAVAIGWADEIANAQAQSAALIAHAEESLANAEEMLAEAP